MDSFFKRIPVKVFFKLKFIYSEKATKFCEIFTLLLYYVVPVKSKVKILQNFVAFTEYVSFISGIWAKFLWPSQNI